MPLDAILDNNQKAIRKLKYQWTSLTNKKNYVIPKTVEEFKQLGFFAPKIRINSIDCYFNEKSKTTLNDFVNTLHKNKRNKKYCLIQLYL